MVTNFWQKLAYDLHSVYWHSVMDRRNATWMCALTPPMTPVHVIKIC